jgi:hypothetical protein
MEAQSGFTKDITIINQDGLKKAQGTKTIASFV